MKKNENIKEINNKKLIRTIIDIFNWKDDRYIIDKILGNIKDKNIRKYYRTIIKKLFVWNWRFW